MFNEWFERNYALETLKKQYPEKAAELKTAQQGVAQEYKKQSEE
jgi:hypothetical protein